MVSFILDFSQFSLVHYCLRLNNCGNTCYVNTTLQALFSLPAYLVQFLEFVNAWETVPICISSLDDIVTARDNGFLVAVSVAVWIIMYLFYSCIDYNLFFYHKKMIANLSMYHPSHDFRQQEAANEFLIQFFLCCKNWATETTRFSVTSAPSCGWKINFCTLKYSPGGWKTLLVTHSSSITNKNWPVDCASCGSIVV